MSAKGNGAASITADHYPTPPSLVTRLLEVCPRNVAGLTARCHHTFLDIGGGEGAISRELIRLGVPPSQITAHIEYRDDASGELLASGRQDAAGTAWFHWGPDWRTVGQRLTLRDRTPGECEHCPPTRRGKKAKPVREEMVNA